MIILQREGLVMEKLLERQHPRDPFKNKGRRNPPDRRNTLPSQKYVSQAQLGVPSRTGGLKLSEEQGD